MELNIDCASSNGTTGSAGIIYADDRKMKLCIYTCHGSFSSLETEALALALALALTQEWGFAVSFNILSLEDGSDSLLSVFMIPRRYIIS